MADSNAANLEDLKRLLRRLDKALPQPPAEKVQPSSTQSGKVRAGGAAGPGSNATALRTIVLASVVSLFVSFGVVTLLFHDTPLRRFIAAQAPAKGSARPAPVQVDGSPTGGERLPAFMGETAALQAEIASKLRMQPAVQEKNTPSPLTKDTVVEAAPTAQAALAAPAAAEQPSSVSLAAVSAAPPPGAKGATTQADTSGAALVELDAAQFLRRGLLMLSRGSISAAQLLLERAADLGSGEAAFALATTYDGGPGAPRRGAEVRPNAELALRWYARAQELGVEAARERLAALKDGTATPSP